MKINVSGDYDEKLPELVDSVTQFLKRTQGSPCVESNFCPLCPANGKFHGKGGVCFVRIAEGPLCPPREFLIKFLHRYYGGVDNETTI